MMFSILYKLRLYCYVWCFDFLILKSNFFYVLKEFWIFNVFNCGMVCYVWFDLFWGLVLYYFYVNWFYLIFNEICVLKFYKICYFFVVLMLIFGFEVFCLLLSLEIYFCFVIDVNGKCYLIFVCC